MTQEQPSRGPRLDTSVASIARIYDYWLGGKDNFAVDRAVGDAMIHAIPSMRYMAKENRKFVHREVTTHMAEEEGIRQFLDIGTGLPTHPTCTRSSSKWTPPAGSSTSTTTRSCWSTPAPC